jgi:hypothetical protein
MVSTGKRIHQLAEVPYDPKVLLEACPSCGADIGDRCTRRFGGRIVKCGPHLERVNLSKPKDPRR